MPEMIQVRDKQTGKTEWQSPLNARDLTTHRADRYEIAGATGSAPVDRVEGESQDAEQIDLLGNRRVKDNIRVADETGVTHTENLRPTGALATDGDEDRIVKTEGTTDDGEDADDDNDTDDGAGAGSNPAAPNGIVRSSSGELVDDDLVTALKGKNKSQLVAFGEKEYGLDLDGRSGEEKLRLAIYDAAEAKNK